MQQMIRNSSKENDAGKQEIERIQLTEKFKEFENKTISKKISIRANKERKQSNK